MKLAKVRFAVPPAALIRPEHQMALEAVYWCINTQDWTHIYHCVICGEVQNPVFHAMELDEESLSQHAIVGPLGPEEIEI